jgi:hypothetical protein
VSRARQIQPRQFSAQRVIGAVWNDSRVCFIGVAK